MDNKIKFLTAYERKRLEEKARKKKNAEVKASFNLNPTKKILTLERPSAKLLVFPATTKPSEPNEGDPA